ncbi:hypothetical protein EZS27_016919 [termite gut metagenome]|uniref:RagB/SusD family nutrient uptake outer membrane protein n=1 Tax=termite gut metagenome TaxID=433724 RepID=A0A5J4RPI1_9ZZZZ
MIPTKKYILPILLSVSMVFFSGCDVEETSDDRLSGDQFWNKGNATNVEAFILSMYSSFRKATMINSGFITVTGDLRCAPIAPSSTDWTSGYISSMANNDLKDLISRFNWREAGYPVNITNWKTFYESIQQANILLKEVTNVPNLSPQQVNSFKAEATFIRNLAYFFLVRVFGDVPYYTNAYNSTPLPRTDMVTVLKSCLSELQAVLDTDPNAEILPWTFPGSSKKAVRATRGGCIALMMHINLWLVQFDNRNSEQYYQHVVDLGDELVNKNGGTYSLLGIDRSSTIFRGGSDEGLFEIVQDINAKENFLFEAIFSNLAAYSYDPGRTQRSVLYYTREFLAQIFPAEITEDRRPKVWFNNSYAPDNVGESSPSVKNERKEITKFWNVDTYSGGQITSNAGNQIVFRYADAILLYAEALAASGNDAEATLLLNRIRNRAGAPEISATGIELQDAIYWERVRELIGEGHYYYDLVRTGKLCDRKYCSQSISRTSFNAGAWTWPIHSDALKNNTYMTLNSFWE